LDGSFVDSSRDSASLASKGGSKQSRSTRKPRVPADDDDDDDDGGDDDGDGDVGDDGDDDKALWGSAASAKGSVDKARTRPRLSTRSTTQACLKRSTPPATVTAATARAAATAGSLLKKAAAVDTSSLSSPLLKISPLMAPSRSPKTRHRASLGPLGDTTADDASTPLPLTAEDVAEDDAVDDADADDADGGGGGGDARRRLEKADGCGLSGWSSSVRPWAAR
jgi:hypothetical protein